MPEKRPDPRLIQPPVNRAAYSDRTAWILAHCSHLAYQKDMKTLKRELKVSGLEMKGAFFCDKNQNFAYLAVHKTYAVLAFKGTVPSESETVKTDADFKLVRARYGEFHQGFLDTYEELAKEFEAALKKLRVPIYITGHSLGGALALVTTIQTKDQDHLAACYTYGCPRVGNAVLADRLFKVPVYRCVHHADLVPAVPFTLMGYRPYGDIRFLSDDDRVCGGSEAVLRRAGATLNPLNIPKLIADHAIERYKHILEVYALSRNP
jgi:pimeloyl-ACP methyl ester carboxylesterase